MKVVPVGPVLNCLICIFVLIMYLCYLHNVYVFFKFVGVQIQKPNNQM